MPPKRQDEGLRRRQARAVTDLRLEYQRFRDVLESVQREADTVLREDAARAGIPFTEALPAKLLKAHARRLEAEDIKAAHTGYARAMRRAVRVGVFIRHASAGKVRISSPVDLKDDEAIQATLAWVAMRQYPLGNREALRMARKGLERGVKDPMTKQDREIASACYEAMGSGGENWAARAQQALTKAGILKLMTRQAFHKRLRALQIPPRHAIKITPLRLTLRRPKSS